jgi:acyl-coenzyme A synthetase/AMP-(fatty) acid ligase
MQRLGSLLRSPFSFLFSGSSAEDRVAAYVIRGEGEQTDEELADELRAWCKARLRRYEYPHVVQFVDDLPRTVNGKVQRFRLRELGGAPMA